ncbi:MAG: hypothetical protein WCA45_07615 [Thiobacillaceae bacterium]
MPESYATAAFTQAGAMAMPACRSPIEPVGLDDLSALRWVEASVPMNINGAE